MMRIAVTAPVIVLLIASTLQADGADPQDKYAWGENIGWTNWADAGDGDEAACLDTNHLEGFVWGENVGFVNLGNGDGPYTNTDGLDFGVNIDPVTGEASGLAWGENIGWINFGTTPFVGTDDGARYDFADDRFRGFAWGENVGWINLDDDVNFVSLNAGASCPGDCDNDGSVSFSDLVAILGEFGTSGSNPGCDADGNGTVSFSDLVTTLSLFGPCP